MSPINQFIACASIAEHHAVLIGDDGSMLYAGRLAGIDEVTFNRAKTSLVHPRTLEWIKQRADEVIRSGKVRLI